MSMKFIALALLASACAAASAAAASDKPLSVGMAVWPLVGMILIRKQSNPVHPGITGAALGAASGAWAGVVVDLWCPVSHPAHIALGAPSAQLPSCVVGDWRLDNPEATFRSLFASAGGVSCLPQTGADS